MTLKEENTVLVKVTGGQFIFLPITVSLLLFTLTLKNDPLLAFTQGVATALFID